METLKSHLGFAKHVEFDAVVHIHELLNVPLLQGEFKVKWEVKNGVIHHAVATPDRNDSDSQISRDGSDRNSKASTALGWQNEDSDTSDEGEMYGSDEDGSIMSRDRNSIMSGLLHPFSALAPRPRSISSSQAQKMSQSPSTRMSVTHETWGSFLIDETHNNMRSSSLENFSRARTLSTPDVARDEHSTHRLRSGHSTQLQPPLPTLKAHNRPEPKGGTEWSHLQSHSAMFNTEFHCPVSIHIHSRSGQLQPCILKLRIKQRIVVGEMKTVNYAKSIPPPRTPSAIRGKSGHCASDLNNEFLSQLSPYESIQDAETGVDEKQAKTEVIKTGSVSIDLARWAWRSTTGQDLQYDPQRHAQKYLLHGSKSNAVLRVGVEMKFLGGEKHFKAPSVLPRNGNLSSLKLGNESSTSVSIGSRQPTASSSSSSSITTTSQRSMLTHADSKESSVQLQFHHTQPQESPDILIQQLFRKAKAQIESDRQRTLTVAPASIKSSRRPSDESSIGGGKMSSAASFSNRSNKTNSFLHPEDTLRSHSPIYKLGRSWRFNSSNSSRLEVNSQR